VGVTVDYEDWQTLFSEDPHRFVFAADPDRASEIEAIAEESGVSVRRIGGIAGDSIELRRGGASAVVDLQVATETYRNAIPRRLA
jgi:selenophosphate synthetase-related protein